MTPTEPEIEEAEAPPAEAPPADPPAPEPVETPASGDEVTEVTPADS